MTTVELRHRHPELNTAHDLTVVRAKLVSNRNLGAALIRRFGEEATLGFFPSLSSIDSSGASVAFFERSSGDVRLCEHIKELANNNMVRPSLPDLVREDTPPIEPGDPIKRLGDVYEALIGLTVLEYKGDVARAWRHFVDDLFGESDHGTAEAASALRKALGDLRALTYQKRVREQLPA